MPARKAELVARGQSRAAHIRRALVDPGNLGQPKESAVGLTRRRQPTVAAQGREGRARRDSCMHVLKL